MTKAPKMKVMPDGSRVWWLHDKLHRTDGPAIEWADGSCEWWLHDKRHRSDGPAFECADGTRAWYLRGQQLTFEQWLAQTTADPAERVMLASRWR